MFALFLFHSHKGRLPPPGLSHTQVKQATGEEQLEPDLLEKVLVDTLAYFCITINVLKKVFIHVVVLMCLVAVRPHCFMKSIDKITAVYRLKSFVLKHDTSISMIGMKYPGHGMKSVDEPHNSSDLNKCTR